MGKPMTERLSIAAEMAPYLHPGETITWSGMSNPLAAMKLLWGQVTWAAVLIAYASGVPYFSELAHYALDWGTRLALALSPEDFVDEAVEWVSTGATLIAAVWGALSAWGLVEVVRTFGRSRHAVTNLRVISLANGGVTSTYLKNVAMVQSETWRTDSNLILYIAGLKVRHAILGVRDMDGAEHAINAGIAASIIGDAASAKMQDQDAHSRPTASVN